MVRQPNHRNPHPKNSYSSSRIMFLQYLVNSIAAVMFNADAACENMTGPCLLPDHHRATVLSCMHEPDIRTI